MPRWFLCPVLYGRVVSHLFTGSLADSGKLPALAGWYIRYGMYVIFCTVRFCGSSILWNFVRTLLKRGAWSIKKGAEASDKRGSCQIYNTEGPYRVFLWYRLGKYQENTNRYHTKIPNQDTTLQKLHVWNKLPSWFPHCLRIVTTESMNS